MAHILVVDDEKSIRLTLSSILQDQGHEVEIAEDVAHAKTLLSNGVWDVVVTDIVLPGLSGVDLLQSIRAASPDVQVIMMTGEPTVQTAAEAVRSGASDYLSKPVGKVSLLRAVENAVKIKRLCDERKRLTEENQMYQQNLERLVAERTRKLEEVLQSWMDATEGTIQAMAMAVECRDPYTAGHQERVARLGQAMAREMGLPDDEIDGVYYAGMTHDLGKIGVPAEILSCPGKLSDAAMSLVRQHPLIGHRILEKVRFPWPIARTVLEHHERLDGSGYPQGLSGEQISPAARILAVADVVDAMASHRPYRPALGIEAALNEITEKRNLWYDAAAVDACVRLFREKGFKFERKDEVGTP